MQKVEKKPANETSLKEANPTEQKGKESFNISRLPPGLTMTAVETAKIPKMPIEAPEIAPKAVEEAPKAEAVKEAVKKGRR